MQENTVVQETTSANQGQISGQNVVRVVEKTETAETKRMKEHFNFFGPVTFLYAVFYRFACFITDRESPSLFFSQALYCILSSRCQNWRLP